MDSRKLDKLRAKFGAASAGDVHDPEFKKVVEEELSVEEPSVIIARRPCILLPQVKTAPPLHVDPDKCKRCKMCMKIGCPAVSFADKKSSIDPTLCVGCGLCRQMCKFGAILDKEGN